MRILVVGAGGTGGYFGGRLLQAGRDVTFLVRPRRAAQLAEKGLVIRSQMGDVAIADPPIVLAENLRDSYDLILLSCKAYDLADAIHSFTPAVGKNTLILPLLNGMRHLDVLDQHFGRRRVLGGLCVISSGVNESGEIIHYNDLHSVTCGDRDGFQNEAREAIVLGFSGCNFEFAWSNSVLEAMWEKWVFIATGAGITCLMRAAVGDILRAGAGHYALQLLDECSLIATQQGFPLTTSSIEKMKQTFSTEDSPFMASMLRDIERGARTEADHVLGDLLARDSADAAPLLNLAYAHVKSYEARRERESSEASSV